MVGRRRRSRAETEALVQEFEASGMTRQVFCAGRGLSVAALDKYRKRDFLAVLTIGRGGSVRIGPYVSTIDSSGHDRS